MNGLRKEIQTEQEISKMSMIRSPFARFTLAEKCFFLRMSSFCEFDLKRGVLLSVQAILDLVLGPLHWPLPAEHHVSHSSHSRSPLDPLLWLPVTAQYPRNWNPQIRSVDSSMLTCALRADQ